MTIDLQLGDAVQWAREYEGELFHALFCDAPYEMNFMGKGWDDSGVAFDPETWRAFARVLHPGAFLFVCAGTINDDLISVAMREAGLRKFHKMGGWAFGSGFPKATRIDTQIDKAAGVEQEKVERTNFDGTLPTNKNSNGSNGWKNASDVRFTTAPATSLARTWAGHRYGLQALKPALEMVLIFQKPYEGKPVDCITATGAGALWVDGGRIGTEDSLGRDNPYNYDNASVMTNQSSGIRGAFKTETHPQGRWPANFYVDGTAELLDAQSGESVSSVAAGVRRNNGVLKYDGHNSRPSHNTHKRETDQEGYSDSGGASRFFFNVAETLEDADPIKRRACLHCEGTGEYYDPADVEFEHALICPYCGGSGVQSKVSQTLDDAELVRYCAKASRRERDAGLDGFEFKQAIGYSYSDEPNDPANGMFKDRETAKRNPHPTVKPLALTRYLATLLLPPAEYAPRRLFVPFAGVGSEAIGAMQAGWEFVQGVEITEEYIPIAQARVEYWAKKEAEAQAQMEMEL